MQFMKNSANLENNAPYNEMEQQLEQIDCRKPNLTDDVFTYILIGVCVCLIVISSGMAIYLLIT